MTLWEIGLGTMIGSAARELYRRWKASRQFIPMERDGDGNYVANLRLKRLEQGVIWGALVAATISLLLFALGYALLTSRLGHPPGRL